MTDLPPRGALSTHDVINQPEGAASESLWTSDPYLQSHAVARGARKSQVEAAAAAYGNVALRASAHDARRDLPRLVTHDRFGRRLDEVQFNTGYHEVLLTGVKAGYASTAWTLETGGHATHAAHVYLLSQVEPGSCCPLTMTYAAVPALALQKDLAEEWLPRLLSKDYDPSIAPISKKPGATLGMAMTEKQGGSDVRANTTRAMRDGDHYRMLGHKWFCSAPMSDGFLTLAQTDKGLTCFLVPRWLEGQRNGISILRLKDKLGNRANASAEIEYDNALAHVVGEEGAGVRTIIQMVHHTRLDTAMAPAGLMRAALHEALHWARHRQAFSKALIDQPLMRVVLADLALDVEAAVALGFMVAEAFDQIDDESRAFARVGVALAKYLNNKRAAHVIGECMEVLGGMGYVEETPLPMLYREAPLNGIWEGSGNVICLDILRSLGSDPRVGEALKARLEAAKGLNAHYDTALAVHHTRWPIVPSENEARWFCESLAVLLSAAALLETAPDIVAEGFITSRLSEHRGTIAGALDLYQSDQILARALSEDSA